MTLSFRLGTPSIELRSIAFFYCAVLFIGYPLFSEILKYLEMNPVEIGYFTKTIALMSLAYVFSWLSMKRAGFKIDGLDVAVFGYLFYTFFINVFYYASGEDHVSVNNFSYILKFVCLYLLVRGVDSERSYGKSKMLFFMFSGFILIKSLLNEFNFFYGPSPELKVVSDYDYQGTALCYIVLYLFYIIEKRKGLGRCVTHVLFLICLAFIGARSELLGSVVFVLCYEFFSSRSKTYFILVGLAFLLMFLALLENNPGILGSRASSLLDIFSSESISDQSALERLSYNYNALATIADKPLLGDFASYPAGEYAHNITSVWVDYGLVGMLLFLSLLFLAYLTVVTVKSNDPQRKHFHLANICFLIFMLLAAKNYNFQMIPVVLGLISSPYWKRRF